MKKEKKNKFQNVSFRFWKQANICPLGNLGRIVGEVRFNKLVEACENIPVEQQPEWMKNLKEDDNPVIMLIE